MTRRGSRVAKVLVNHALKHPHRLAQFFQLPVECRMLASRRHKKIVGRSEQVAHLNRTCRTAWTSALAIAHRAPFRFLSPAGYARSAHHHGHRSQASLAGYVSWPQNHLELLLRSTPIHPLAPRPTLHIQMKLGTINTSFRVHSSVLPRPARWRGGAAATLSATIVLV